MMYLSLGVSCANISATAPSAAKLNDRNMVFLAPIADDMLPAAIDDRASPILITITF